jgi:hypothetical protein
LGLVPPGVAAAGRFCALVLTEQSRAIAALARASELFLPDALNPVAPVAPGSGRALVNFENGNCMFSAILSLIQASTSATLPTVPPPPAATAALRLHLALPPPAGLIALHAPVLSEVVDSCATTIATDSSNTGLAELHVVAIRLRLSFTAIVAGRAAPSPPIPGALPHAGTLRLAAGHWSAVFPDPP